MRRRHCEAINFETEHDCEIEVIKFTGISCKSLEDNVKKQHSPQRSHISAREAYGEAKLEIIVALDGCMTRHPTVKQRESGRKLGIAVS